LFFLCSSSKLEDRRAEHVLPGGEWGGEFCSNGRREVVGKEVRRVNIVQILCAHVSKWKNDTCWSYCKNGGANGSGRRGESNYDIFDTL
jgi:hypothetical protein